MSAPQQEPPLKRARNAEGGSAPAVHGFSISAEGPRGGFAEANAGDAEYYAATISDDAATSGETGKVEHKLLGSVARVAIIGAGYVGGQPIRGVEDGPRVIREANLVRDIKSLGWKVDDLGDLEFDHSKLGTPEDAPVFPSAKVTDETVEAGSQTVLASLKNCRTVGAACKSVRDAAFKHASQKELVLTLGGDHSLAIGSITGVADSWGRSQLRVIWVDAHGDINTPSTTPSGNLHGMPVAFLLDMVHGMEVPGFEWMDDKTKEEHRPVLTPDQIVFVGLRDVDPGEKRNLKAMGIKCFTMKEVDRFGIGKIMKMAIKHIDPMGRYPLHLSYDVDGIDPAEIPSTGTRVKGGLTYREAMYVCETVADTGRLVSMDLVEVNPSIGTADDVKMTAATAVALVRSALGQTLL